jgi:gamma-glutamyl hercynylcysteine S-oxide hydrolase
MCRHFAWLGSPRTLGSLMLEPEHGLLVQSYAPRRQRYGRLNADGWGVGFWTPGRDEPSRWRSNRPLWSDASFGSVAPAIASRCVLGAVRSATVGMPLDESAAAPFQSGRWLVSHNGRVDRVVLGPHADAESACDSAILAAHLFDLGPTGVGKFVTDVGTRDPAARLNVLATDGEQVLATTWGDTLSVLQTDDGLLIASEPFDDDPRWADVPDHRLVTATATDYTITELEN